MHARLFAEKHHELGSNTIETSTGVSVEPELPLDYHGLRGGCQPQSAGAAVLRPYKITYAECAAPLQLLKLSAPA
jgi:hypothetical protein